ncbi:hypothetical protein, partial [Fangia hongkongensis]
SEAKSQINNIKTAADKAQNSVDELKYDVAQKTDTLSTNISDLDDKYQQKTDAISKQINNLEPYGFTLNERVIYAKNGQSLSDLIKLAQSDKITPKLDKDHPVTIKLMPNAVYDISKDEKLNFPSGLVIDGSNSAKIIANPVPFSRDNRMINNICFENLIIEVVFHGDTEAKNIFNLNGGGGNNYNITFSNVKVYNNSSNQVYLLYRYYNVGTISLTLNRVYIDNAYLQPDVTIAYFEENSNATPDSHITISHSDIGFIYLTTNSNNLQTGLTFTNSIGDYCYYTNQSADPSHCLSASELNNYKPLIVMGVYSQQAKGWLQNRQQS